MWAMIGCSIAMAIWTAGIVWMCAREKAQEASSHELSVVGKHVDDVPAAGEMEKV